MSIGFIRRFVFYAENESIIPIQDSSFSWLTFKLFIQKIKKAGKNPAFNYSTTNIEVTTCPESKSIIVSA